MTGYQRGDYIYSQDGKRHFLRLTLGALAEICAQFDIDSPLALAKTLRAPSQESLAKILTALARPAHGDVSFKAIKPETAMTAIAVLFEAAFNKGA